MMWQIMCWQTCCVVVVTMPCWRRYACSCWYFLLSWFLYSKFSICGGNKHTMTHILVVILYLTMFVSLLKSRILMNALLLVFQLVETSLHTKTSMRQILADGSHGACYNTLSKASSVFSGLALSAWEASMMGMGMKRIVKFLLVTQPEDKIEMTRTKRGNWTQLSSPHVLASKLIWCQ